MRILFSLAVVTVAVACSSNGGSGPSAGACKTAEDCIPFRCVCGDAHTADTATICAGGSCGDPGSECTSLCQDHNGVTSSGPEPNVASSSECVAFCQKGASLNCPNPGPCGKYFFCRVDPGQCEASVRAYLGCEVTMGTWACGTSGGWGVASSCSSSTSLCGGGDGGTD